jgi:hypothetical protein
MISLTTLQLPPAPWSWIWMQGLSAPSSTQLRTTRHSFWLISASPRCERIGIEYISGVRTVLFAKQAKHKMSMLMLHQLLAHLSITTLQCNSVMQKQSDVSNSAACNGSNENALLLTSLCFCIMLLHCSVVMLR